MYRLLYIFYITYPTEGASFYGRSFNCQSFVGAVDYSREMAYIAAFHQQQENRLYMYV